jgi:acetolactate synthase-1/2/3 large subunit
VETNTGENAAKIKPQTILHELEKAVPEDTIVISDVGAHKIWIARAYQPNKPNRTIISNGFASMGIAIPGAIGAKLACPEDPVVCITGMAVS